MLPFSVITIFNNKDQLDTYLLKSLENQTVKFQKILIDNRDHKFKTIAKALNEVALNNAVGKYIVFIHQDVDLLNDRWLENAFYYLESLSDLGIAGVAGMSEVGTTNDQRGRNSIFHGIPPVRWSWGRSITHPEPVQTLDECVLIIPREIFMQYHFDEEVLDDWHLYGVDYSLTINSTGKHKAYVLPMNIHHASQGGSMTIKYFNTMKKVITKHKQNYKRIYTTMGDFSTHGLDLFIKKIKYKLKN